MQLKRALFIILLWAAACPVFGFSLLGPYTDWMTRSNGYRRPMQLGGPMNIGEEYRWNLPVITYGFDPEFVAYFGPDGVRAVERALAFITNLPPASQIQLEDYGLQALLRNHEGNALGLKDLTSVTLQWLLHQLGLAPPGHYAWTMGEWTNDSFAVIQRNFDPAALAPTNLINEMALHYQLVPFDDGSIDAREMLADPLAIPRYAAADAPLQTQFLTGGGFINALTRDDVGGWRYLYSRDNVNLEPLPKGITVAGSTRGPVPNIAPRPGIEKINFLPTTWDADARRFNSLTNVFELTYITNGMTRTQKLQRIVTTPDIQFGCRDLGGRVHRGFAGEYFFSPKPMESTDTSHWPNLSPLNGDAAAGPGLIIPGARLTFSKLGKYRNLVPPGYQWGSFDGTSNPPLTFLGAETLPTLTLDNYIQPEGTNLYFTTVTLGEAGAVYRIESSTNLIDWTPFTTVTNGINYYDQYFSFRDRIDSPKKFYRATRL